jgi:hypothetical protein
VKRALRTTFVIATLGVFGAIGVGPLASVAGAQELDLCALLGDPYCPPDGTGSGTSDTVVPGGSITVHGEGFLAGETVDITLRSTPIPLGSFTADADGEVTATVTIPADAEPGTHTIVMYGLTSHV